MGKGKQNAEKFDRNLYLMRRMEEKLIELMDKEEYSEFSTQIARECFQEEIEAMAPSGFKNYCLEFFDDITK